MKDRVSCEAAIWIYTLILLILAARPVCLQAAESAGLSPLNPKFTTYMSNRQLQKNRLSATSGQEHPLGYIPSPIDRSYLKTLSQSKLKVQGILPSSYDLRTEGRVTAVRNQGSCGDCWAFAAMGSVESNLLIGETRDFSENNLKNTAGFEWGACEGGNEEMSTAYMTRWSGPIDESDDPYSVSSSVSPTGLTTQKHQQEVLFLPGRQGPLDNDVIKQAIMDYGAVAAYYAHYDSYYKSSTHSYYYNGSATSNHAISIVGWNDNYSASNFSTTPPGDGAFIIKNSWGTGWGESGYFYISYYDAQLGMEGNYVFRQSESAANYDNIYQYDPLGNTLNYGYGSTTGWFANIFTSTADDYLSAVGFYTASQGSSYEIYTYTDVGATPASGTLAGSATSGSISEAGFHTVTLSSPVKLTSGQKFSIVVKLTTPGYIFPIPLERPIGGYASPTASSGQSFVSGSGANWSDITSYYSNTNVCLKGFTIMPPTVTSTSPTDGTTGVALTSQINATFSEDMDSSSLTSATFSLDNGVTGTVSYDSATKTATFTPSNSLASNTLYTATITTGAKDSAGNSMITAKTWSFTTENSGRNLAVTINGTGTGSVNSDPSGIACESGNSGTCSNQFTYNSSVTLIPSASSGSLFDGWTGTCSSTSGDDCIVTIDSDKSLTASFRMVLPVMIEGGTDFNTLQEASDSMSGSTFTLMVQSGELTGSLDAKGNNTIYLKGGYNSDYSSNTGGITMMNGALTLSNGSMTIENLTIK